MPVLLVLMLGLEFYQHATSSGPAGSDFAIYHKAATRLAADPDSLYREITKGQPEDWIYPPPAILPILPFRNFGIAPGFFVWMALVYVALAASGLAWHELAGRAGPAWKPVLLFTALTPGFHAARNGQMDPFVLLICLAYLIALGRDRAALAGISLALGVWIKIYPAVLLVMALFHPKARRVFTWFAGAMVAVPVIVLPIVPLRVEVAYFGEYLPAVAQNTEPHIYNQSLIGFLSRQSLGPFPAVFDSWAIVPVAAVHKAAAALVVLTFVGIVLWRIRARGFATDVSDAFLLLAIVPVASPLGWCHAYVYAIPAVAWCLWNESNRMRLAGITAALVFCVPGYRVLPLGLLPAILQNLGNTRFLFAALLPAGAIMREPPR